MPVAGRTPETLLASFRQNKKQDVKKALKQDLTFRKLETRAEIDAFHALLRQNLQKFGVEPVHTADELWEFKTSRLPDIAGFYGVFADEQMVAGGMTFYFAQANVLHTQYLAGGFVNPQLQPGGVSLLPDALPGRRDGLQRPVLGHLDGGTRQGAELRPCGEQGRVRELPCREPRLYKNL